MHTGTLLGLLATLAAGVLQGTMLAPMKYLRKWQWENVWLVYAAFAYFLLPWVVAAATIPHLGAVYSSTSSAALLRTALFGIGWGCAVVLFGLGIEVVGLALGYAIILGLGTTLGALIPLITLHPQKLWTQAGLGTIAGVLLLVVSVGLSSLAGKMRDLRLREIAGKNPPAGLKEARSKASFVKGLVFCILSGVLNPLINFALAYGTEMQSHAIRYGANPALAANAIWVVVSNAGFIPNVLYCMYLLSARSTWRVFPAARPRYWVVASAMGFMWMAGMVLYGVGTNLMGMLGVVIGWPLFVCSMILTATSWGFITGEWKGVHGVPRQLMGLALTVLIVAILVLAWSSRF